MPRRTPTHLKMVRGGHKPSDINPNEPQGTPGIPPPPKHLTKEERNEWQTFAKQLALLGVASLEDAAALELLSCKQAEVRRLRAFQHEHGDTYETRNDKGLVMRRPYPEVTLLKAAEKELRCLLGAFGLTPATRPGINAAPHDPSRPVRHRDPDTDID